MLFSFSHFLTTVHFLWHAYLLCYSEPSTCTASAALSTAITPHPTSSSPFSVDHLPTWLFHSRSSWGEMGGWACQKPEGVGMAGSGQGERPSRERRETGEPWEWSTVAKPRALQGFPCCCCCFGLLCPESHAFLCKCERGVHVFVMLPPEALETNWTFLH